MRYNPELVKYMKEQYPPGTRIRLESMEDPYAPVPPGTEGSVNFVDDAGQLHMKWDNGRTLAIIPGVDHFSVIPQPLQTLKLYMPLTVKFYEEYEFDDPCELDDHDILSHEDRILAAILKERTSEKTERGLMEYYHEDDSVNKKVKSYVFTVEQVGNKLMGVAECRVQGDLNSEEMELLKDDIMGQAADGFGEGFEQRPIKTSDGEIYVSLWNCGKSWRIMTQDELSQSQQMGGMQLG